MINKIIHQIFHNFKEEYPPCITTCNNIIIPDKWKKSEIEWKRLHPDYEYKLWNSYESRELIKNNYTFFLETYDNYKYPIQRVDAARYFILYHYGGIYSDLDLYPKKSINSYIENMNDCDVYMVYEEYYVANSFIVSKKGVSFWKDVFCLLKEKQNVSFPLCLSKHYSVMSSTGPLLFNEAVKNYKCGILGRLPKIFYNHQLIDECNSDQVLVALDGMSWCGVDSYILSTINSNKKLLLFLTIIIVLIIIILLVYFIRKYYMCKKSGF